MLKLVEPFHPIYSVMITPSNPRLVFSRLLAVTIGLIFGVENCAAQIAGPVNPGERVYSTKGMTDQPFTVQIVGARRTVANVLLIKLSLTNDGSAPLAPRQDFAGDDNPADENKISALYAVDPNGRKKYAVIRDAQNQALCSTINPPIKPGERRMLYAQLPAPPTTSSVFDLYFPKANVLVGIPMGLPQAGEPIVPGADVVDTTGLPATASVTVVAPTPANAESANNNEPTLYTNQTNPVLPSTPLKGVGTVQSANSTVPFTVDVLGLTSAKAGGSTLKLAVTNNGSGSLDATGQFTGGLGDTAEARRISGVYLVDPVSKQRFDVMRDGQGGVAASKVDPAFGPGERRTLEAHFPEIPDTVKSVYVYFPHTTPIADVPVTR